RRRTAPPRASPPAPSCEHPPRSRSGPSLCGPPRRGRRHPHDLERSAPMPREISPLALGKGRRQTLRPWLGLALALLAGAAPAAAQAPSNVVYVESNVADPAIGNAILAYTRAADGSLTPLGSYPTGGTGVSPTFDLGPFDSDQNI